MNKSQKSGKCLKVIFFEILKKIEVLNIKSFFRKYLFRKPSTSGIGIIKLSIARPFFYTGLTETRFCAVKKGF